MKISGRTIELNGNELACAVDVYLLAQAVMIDGPRTIRVATAGGHRRETGERWHEIYDDKGIICQVSFGTPLAEFLVDLPCLVESKPGIGPSDYWCACKDDEKLWGLLERVRSAKANGHVSLESPR